MNKILIFHSNKDFLVTVSQYIKNTCNIESDIYENIVECMRVAGAFEYSMILSVDKIKDEEGRVLEAAKDILNLAIENTPKVPLIVFGEVELSFGNVTCVKPDIDLQDISKLVIKNLNISKEDLEFIKMPDFVGIDIKNFYQLNNPCSDIYIRIKKQEGDQFVKRINAGEQMDKDIVKKYQNMNLEEFFVKKENYQAIMNQILGQSIARVVSAHKTGDSILEVNADSFEISQNLLDQMGITVATVKMARVAIKSMMKTLSANNKISSLLKDLMQNESSYAFKRCYMISLFGNQLLPEMGWGRGEQLSQNLEKLTFVAFFHDCFLKDEKLLRIMSNSQLEHAQLTGSDKTLVLEHANRASTLAQSIPQCPSGIDVIIRQHHGAHNGIGFPEQYTSSVSPLAIFFIVLEAFCTEVLESLYEKKKLSLDEIFMDLEERFTLPSYRKVVESLKLSVLKR